jgi:hypothetical protein
MNVMRISDISTIKQSFIAIYDGKNGFSYLSPGEIRAKAIVPFSLSNVFKEFCYDDFSKAVEIGAVAGHIRAPYPNELWKNTADTLVMLKPIKYEHLVSNIWSLYRGLEGLIRNENFPILIPDQSMIYNGMKVLEYLANFPGLSFKVEETLQYWKNLPKMMEKEITREKPLQQKNTETTFSTYEMTACAPLIEAKIIKKMSLPRAPASNAVTDSWRIGTTFNTKGEKITGNKATIYTSNGMSRRSSARIRAHGVVVMTDLEKPVVATSYDIAPGGVSFVHLSDLGVVGIEIMMDILLFDTHTNKEHSVSQVKGMIRWKERVFDPESEETILRFGVEFISPSPETIDFLTRLYQAVHLNRVNSKRTLL